MEPKDQFMASIIAKLEETLKRDAQVAVQEHIGKFRSQLINIEETNQKSLDTAIANYHDKRKALVDQLEKKVNKTLTDIQKKMDAKIANIDDELFNDRNKLYQKLVDAAAHLKRKREEFVEERKLWDKDDRRCAEWLGITYETAKVNRKKPNIGRGEDDEKKGLENDDEEPANNEHKQIENVSDHDFIVIKVDDRVFRTYRGTLTQIKGSFIEKLFGPHHHMIHRDDDGGYCLNCNPNTFADVLEILRKRGSIPTDFKMTPTLYAALLEFGILEEFFPAFKWSEIAVGSGANKLEYHTAFQSFRSTANSGTYLRWNIKLLSSVDAKEEEKEYWQLNDNDDSEIIFLNACYYRVVFRCCINCSGAAYARMYINGAAKDMSYHYNNNSNHLKSYNFNDIIQFNEGDKLRLYANTAANAEAKVSYLCIERIPQSILNSVGIWTSSATDSYYRQWNNVVKGCDRYSLSDSNKRVTFEKGGLYRICARVHSNHTAAGARDFRLYEYRNGGNQTFYNYQSVNCAGIECHIYNEIISIKKNDYITLYDANKGTQNDVHYQRLHLEYIPFAHMIGHWRSHSNKDNNIRVWDYEYWCNDMLYELSADKTKIEIKENGKYRIGAHLTNTQPSGQGHSSLFINDGEYCLSRMGCYNGSWYHTTSIQEIVSLDVGDKVHFYSTAPYAHYQYNSLFIEKLL